MERLSAEIFSYFRLLLWEIATHEFVIRCPLCGIRSIMGCGCSVALSSLTSDVGVGLLSALCASCLC